MAGAYWDDKISPETFYFLFDALLICYAIGIVFSTVAAIVRLAQGKPVTWKDYGTGLLTSGLMFYAFAFVIFLVASPFILVWMMFFR